MALQLFEHNEKAYHTAVRMMEQYGKAAIVHPTDKRKSYIANEMTLGEAVVRGILPAPKYVTAVYQYQKTLARYQARVDNLRAPGIQDVNQKYLDALRRALEQADGLDRVFAHHITNKCGKYIVFCANGEGDKIVTERFEVVEQVHDCRVLFERLQASLSSSWDHYFSEASIYYAEHGNLNVPKLYTTPGGLSLGVWLVTQRCVREGQIQGNLTEQQIARLDSIGMVWGNRKEIAWQHGFEVARKYHDTYGNLMVPGKYVDPDGYPLGQWIIKTRQQKLNDLLKEERIAQLDELGMVWNIFDAKWETAYALAAAYYEENGNLNIPRSYVTAAGERLGQWVASQQWACPKGKLTDEQVERLNRIGMYWGNRNDRQWNEGYQEARRYFDAHGDLNVPAGYVSPEGYNLGNWVKRQRYTRHNPEKSCAVLTEERIAKLDEIGMRWEKADSRTHRLELAQEPKRKSESLNVLADHKTGEGIGLCSRLFDPE